MIFGEVCTKPGNFEQITETEQEKQNLSELYPGYRTLCMDRVVVISSNPAATRFAPCLATNETRTNRATFLAIVAGGLADAG